MLLGDSSSRIANATERLFSPVFPREYSNDSCFTFWYLLRGETAGKSPSIVRPFPIRIVTPFVPFRLPQSFCEGRRGGALQHDSSLLGDRRSIFEVAVRILRPVRDGNSLSGECFRIFGFEPL